MPGTVFPLNPKLKPVPDVIIDESGRCVAYHVYTDLENDVIFKPTDVIWF